jgi:hypothetical protein
MKINTIGHLVKTNPIKPNFSLKQTQSNPISAQKRGQQTQSNPISSKNAKIPPDGPKNKEICKPSKKSEKFSEKPLQISPVCLQYKKRTYRSFLLIRLGIVRRYKIIIGLHYIFKKKLPHRAGVFNNSSFFIGLRLWMRFSIY